MQICICVTLYVRFPHFCLLIFQQDCCLNDNVMLVLQDRNTYGKLLMYMSGVAAQRRIPRIAYGTCTYP